MSTIGRVKSVILLSLAASVPLAWLAFSQQSTKSTASPLDPDTYAALMASRAETPEELFEDFFLFDSLDLYNRIMPPHANLYQREGALIPIRTEAFAKILDQLASEYAYSVPVYRIVLTTDSDARRVLVLDAETGQVRLEWPMPDDYDPFSLVKERYPRLYTGGYASELVREMEQGLTVDRISLEATLIPIEYAEFAAFAMQEIDRHRLESAASEGGDEGGMMMLMGGSDSNIVMASVTKLTNGQLAVSVAYPEDFTNRLDIFFATDLLDRDWKLAADGLSTTGTNVVTWVTTNAQSYTRGFYAAGNADLDSDEDGFPDARERFLYKTNPDDPDSHPVVLTGEITYDGAESGPVYVLAVMDTDSWSKTWSVTLPSPGAYANLVANQETYWFKAFMDVNGNQSRDSWEPQGLYSGGSLYLTTDVSGLDIALEDQPSIWGTLDYTGSVTGNIHVIAVTAPDSWDTSYQSVITWIQGEASLTGGPTYVSFPVSYSITGLPPDDYWIRAFIDANEDGQFMHLEPGGQYAVDAIPVSNRVSGVNFTIAQDTDQDAIPDWWEMQYFGGPTNAVDSADPDNDGLNNWEEFLYGTDPTNPDSDGDWFLDGYEVQMGYDPLDDLDAPGFVMVINDGASHTSSTNLLINFPGIIADTAEIGETSDFSDGITQGFGDDLPYSLKNDSNGVRRLYARLFRDSEESPHMLRDIIFDNVPPLILGTSPTNGWVTNRRWIKITGETTDTVSGVRVFVNEEWAHGGSVNTFWHDRIKLALGTNQFEIKAVDLAGNETNETIQVILDPSGDTTPPSLDLFLPGQTTDTNGYCSALYGDTPDLYFRGETDEETAQVQVYAIAGAVTNGPWEAVVVGTQVWGYVELMPGTNLIWALAIDAAGNTSTAACHVVRDMDVVFRITYPEPYQVMNVASTVVHGIASPMFLTATITVNNVATTIEDHGSNITFTTVSGVPLNVGRTEIIGRAEGDGFTYYTDPPPSVYEVLSYRNHRHFTDNYYSYNETNCFLRVGEYIEDVDHMWDAQSRMYSEEWTSEDQWIYRDPDSCIVFPGGIFDGDLSEIPMEQPTSYILIGHDTWIWDTTAGSTHWTSRQNWTYKPALSIIKRGDEQERQLVVLQFPNMWYETFDYAPIDPSAITYLGQTGFVYSGNISFIVPITTEVEHTIRDTDFEWPSYAGEFVGWDLHMTGKILGFSPAVSNHQIHVNIDSVWSDQYSGIDANRLPDSSGSGGYDYLLMGARDDNKFYAKAAVSVDPDTPEIRDRLIFNWAGVSGSSYILNPANNATLSDNIVTLASGEKEAEDHAFVVGVDLNGDGILQANEIIAASEYRFKPITQGQYTTEKTILQALYWPPGLIFPTAYSFLDSFLNDTTPSGAATANVTIDANEPTHNVGVLFGANGTAPIKRHAFFTTSDLSDRIYGSTEFQESLTVGTFATRHMEVQNYFNTHTNDVHTFTWNLPSLIAFGDGSVVSFDLHSSFGTATLSGTAEVTVQREGLDVLSVFVECLITDLYDWDYNHGNPDTRAARVQSGFNTLGDGGHIYRVLVDISKYDTTLEYDFQ